MRSFARRNMPIEVYYCVSKRQTRKFQEQATAKFYKRAKPVLHPVERWSHCFYCGLPADTWDHVIPVSYLAGLLDAGFVKYSPVVPACRECNVLAGSAVFEDFAEKRAYVRTRLQKRYKDLLKMPYWFPEQIAEMGPNMAKRIRADMVRQQEVFDRLEFDYTLVGSFEPRESDLLDEPFDVLEWRRIWRPRYLPPVGPAPETEFVLVGMVDNSAQEVVGFFPTQSGAETAMANASLTSAYYWVWIETLEYFLEKTS